ncbi:MAG: hypothetical protein A2840_00460 [Candidatus Buchananbacteria bacterium RIFCSPHIGHO2_01_FULL_47_11b]|uniref:Glycosyltransferase RgtA/B/C/D-like domain-containing protein n=1 Tax=Candidatus Buchananbacteria bacterium RIFCSPHIGHO2_01_FULL_47_11b TaxID=1797537 RepID=A0A1G1Y3Q6_9BACT|nr:MAG: hypothetical protein A2840_00460 [Candidatus Buchananbacteria bacterium RIFCSPHIGHO2_01_FULL_47_11b]
MIQYTNSFDDILLYIPRGRDIYDGHFPPSDSSSDAGGAPGIMPWLPQTLFAGLIAIFKNINTAYLSAVFLFSALIFILLKKLGDVLFQKKLWSYFFAFAGIFTTIPMQSALAFRSVSNFINIIVKDFYPIVNTPLDKFYFIRMDYPLLTTPFLIGAVIALLIFWQKPTQKTAFFSAFLTGISAYVYFHYFGFLTMLSGLLVLYLLFFDLKKHTVDIKTIVVFIGTGILTTFPFFLNYLTFNHSPIAQEYLTRVSNTEHGRSFRWTIEAWPMLYEYFFYLVLAIFIFVVFYRLVNNKKIATFYWFSILTMVLVWNIQLVIGFLPDPGHWLKPFSFILFVLIFHAIYVLCQRFSNITFIARLVATILFILILSMSTKKIINATFFIHPDELIKSSYSFNPTIIDSWDWINNHLPHEPKIVSNSFLTAIYLNTYTSARSYLPIGNISSISNLEIKERFLVANKIFQTPVNLFETYLIPSPVSTECSKCITNEAQNKIIFSQFLDFRISEPKKNEVRWYEDQKKVDALISQYTTFPEVDLANFESDYLYYGPWEKSFTDINFDANQNLELIFRNSEVSIYKILKKL